MSTYIKNYGITKTIIKENGHKLNHQIKWMGDYDGNNANIQLDIDNNGSKEFVSMELDNDDLMKMLGVQPVEMSLDKRLSRDFLGESYTYKPIVLEGTLIKKKTRKHRRHRKKHHRRHNSSHSKKRRTHKI